MHKLKIEKAISLSPGKKFSFLHPPNWVVINLKHHVVNVCGFANLRHTNPNSTRMKVWIVYTPKDSFLDSNTGKPVRTSRALTNLEEDAHWYFYLL